MPEVYQDRLFAVEKVCSKCGDKKPLEAFNRNRQARDGRCSPCKECESHARRVRIQADPEHAKAVKARWRGANKDKVKKSAHKSRNKPEYWAEIRRKRKENPEKFREYERRWRQRNPQGRIESQRRWREENPELWASYRRARRAATDAAVNDLTTDEWIAKLAEYEGKCHWCERDIDGKTEMDHVMPISRGGGHTINNVVPACENCNRRKSASLPDDWRARLERERLTGREE